MLTLAAQTIDAIEEAALFIIAQWRGESPRSAFSVAVKTDTEFSMEGDVERISRILEAAQAGDLRLPPEMLTIAVLKFAEASPELFGDLDETVEGDRTRREVVEQQARAMFEGALELDGLQVGNTRENNIAVLAMKVRELLEEDGLLEELKV